MSSLIHTALSTELTCIPSSLERILGPGFDNTLCNGVTWLFAALFLLHACYNKLLNVYLKQAGYTPYLRMRLGSSLWLLAFCVSFFAYYLVTVGESFMNVNAQHEHDEEVPTEKVVVYAVICSFFLHMAYDYGVRLGSAHAVMKFGALLVVFTSAYILRYLEIPFTLTALLAVSGILEELSKISYSLLDKSSSSKLSTAFLNGIFICSVLVSCAIYFAVIPLAFLVPLGKTLLLGDSSLVQKTLFVALLGWLNFVIYKSVLLNLIFHWLYHRKALSDNEESDYEGEALEAGCLGNTIECSLFPPRTDEGFMLAFLRYEVKMRQKRMIAKRKPKSRNMLLQTLKCMVAIKRKLSEKRAAYSEADDGHEATEQEHLITNEETEQDEDAIQMKRSVKMLRFSDVLLVRTMDDEKDDEAAETEIVEQAADKDHANDETSESKQELNLNMEAVGVGVGVGMGESISFVNSIIAEAVDDVLKNDDPKEFGGDDAGCGNGKCKAVK